MTLKEAIEQAFFKPPHLADVAMLRGVTNQMRYAFGWPYEVCYRTVQRSFPNMSIAEYDEYMARIDDEERA